MELRLIVNERFTSHCLTVSGKIQDKQIHTRKHCWMGNTLSVNHSRLV